MWECHTPVLDEHVDLILTQEPLNCFRSQGFLSGHTLLVHIRYTTKPIRTYNPLNQLKIVVMGDSDDAICAFLSNTVNKDDENRTQTNLRNVVQDPNERVAVLAARCHPLFSINWEGYLHSGDLGLASLPSRRRVAYQACRGEAQPQPEGQCRVLRRCASL